MQDTGYPFISLKKIPEFVRQAKRPTTTFKGYTDMDFELAHDPEYVRGIFRGTIKNGFGNTNPEVNQSLRYSNASIWHAVEYVGAFGGAACSPTQGFHHARYDSAFGYCTFNGLVIAAIKALNSGLVSCVAIIDGDGHFGDGTHQIINKLGLQRQIRHVTRDEMGNGAKPSWDHRMWEQYTKDLIEHTGAGIIVYQAGADAWVDDPYGAGYLTMEGLAHRDRGIFTAAKKAEVPLVWNLAGGYAEDMQDTIDIHLQTLRICDEVYYNAIL
jgi:acetoin utilization deacetylase AcuC-like enzyme